MSSDRFFVKTLTLENFRCFEKAELGPFDPHFNLLVGTNGTGKSSVLLALANLLREVANSPAGIAKGPLVGDLDVRVDQRDTANKLEHKATRSRGKISSSLEWGAESFVFSERFGDERGNVKSELLRPFHEQTSGAPVGLSWPDTERAYPLIVRFTTNRHFQRRMSIGDDVPEPRPDSRWDAFRDWPNAGADCDVLQRWMRSQTLIALQDRALDHNLILDGNGGGLNSGGRPTPHLQIVQSAVQRAVEGASSIEYVERRKDIVVAFEGGRTLDFSNMSDGQRALVGMVAEIARRACLLNSSYLGERVLEETTGLVLIDELDLHLHPRWQRRVIGDLKRIFPKIQFFATTHSPQVISEARPEEIVLLTPEGQKRPPQSYGMDSNWVLECVMEAEGRDPTVAKEIAHLYDEIEDGKFEEARARIAKLRKEIGGFGDVEAAESYMWRVEHEGDEAAE
ncbi:MAG: AAA family ATPase [Roseiarcus sp.]|uniref:AAA family ATPase n=1 Tax=Roseiarcus sp. TaxID=1969460 RepID=UPI003C25D63B